MNTLDLYLEPGDVIDSASRTVIEYTQSILGEDGALTDIEKAVKLYYCIRDDIRYDPYLPFYLPEHYRSSNVIKLKKGFCIQKAGLLCAAARAAGIPARIGFATVRNHIMTRQLLDYLGSDVISFHGYTEMWLEGKWVKATPAFNASLCRHFRVPPLDFNGKDDSIMQEFNSDSHRFMEYIAYHGEFQDIPVEAILSTWEKTYGRDRVRSWIEAIENRKENTGRDFMKEDIV